MKSYFGGCGTGDTMLHMLEYFDGQHTRQVEVFTLYGVVCWTEKTIPGILETGINYKTVKRRIAAMEKRCCVRT